MKLKKIKIKKRNKNYKNIRNKVEKMNRRQEPKKTTGTIIAIILISALVFLIVGTKVFGFLPSILFTIIYLLMMLLVRVIDRNPIGSRKRKRAKRTFLLLLLLGIIGVIAFIVFFIIIIISAPQFNAKNLQRNETTVLYNKDGKVITSLGNEKREKLKYDELPNVLVDAVVATEDSRFFQHNGLDAPRFAKAVMGQLAGHSDAGGGSTLTMQVSKNSFTSTEASGIKGIMRKFTDIYLSIFKIERKYTKQEIIEFYVNQPFLGSNSYGVEQAARTYFGKHANELNLAEASLIAGLFQAPTAYDPFVDIDAATKRRSVVLSLMVRHGYITEEEKEIAEQVKIEDLLDNTDSDSVSEYQGYIDLVVQEIINKTGMDPYTVPMLVYTNMDNKKQERIYKVFTGKSHTWVNKSIQGAAVAVESKTGKVIAVGAGRNRTGERTFNYATDISRQIGSTAKPIFDYGPAIEYNDWSTGHILRDEPWTYSGSSIRLVNADGRYMGNMSIRYALSNSRNVPAVKTFQSVNNKKIKKFATSLGIKPEIDSEGGLHEAHAVGAFNGASPLQIAGAYAAFSNGGVYHEPYSVSKIVLRDSEEKIEFKPEGERAMSEATAYMITDILRDVPSINSMTGLTSDQFAMKTGTTNYDQKLAAKLGYSSDAAPDGWIAGYTPDISLAMWTGYIKNKRGVYLTMNEMYYHRNSLYRDCARAIFNNNGAKWTKPSSVVKVRLEKGTEQLASAYTPASMVSVELFKRGTEPSAVSKAYNKLPSPSGVSVDYSNGKVTISWHAVKKPSDSKEDGEFGYYVYLDGELLGFTTDTSYTYSGSNPFGTYTVKAAFKGNTTTMSSGASKSLKQHVKISRNVSATNKTIAAGSGESYTPVSSPFTITENGVDVTAAANVTTTIYKDGKVVNEIDTSEPATYKVVYSVKYDDKEDSVTVTITVS